MSWLWKWFTDRWPFYQLRDLLLKEEIPGGASFSYTLGTSLIMVFTLQAATGVLQLFYYVPTVDHAYDSVSYLRTEVPFGWLIHNMHYWGAQAMVVIAALHMARVYIWGAYKKTPLTWFFGIALVVTIMALSFTGAPLIWDQKGYWAGEVGSSIAGEVPVAGDILKIILRGSEVMGQLALSRFFAFHIAIFAPLLALLIGAHMASFRTSGVGGSWSEAKRKMTGPLWPDQIFKDMAAATVVFLVLIALASFAPVPFAGFADTLNISYVPKPEWNFLFVYQGLKYFKGPLEPIGAGGLPVVFLLPLLLVPIIDRNPERNPFRRPVAMACLGAYAALILTLTIVGYLSPGFAQMPQTPAKTTQPPKSQVSQGQAASSSTAIEAGRQVFQSKGCTGCHKVHGQGGSIGPELSGQTLVGKSRKWIEDQVRNPKSHFPQTIMPSFAGLSTEQLNNLVSYLLSLSGGTPGPGAAGPSGGESARGMKSKASAPPGPAAPAAGVPTEEKSLAEATGEAASIIGSAENGADLFKHQCIACHGPEGRGSVPNPGSDDGTVPPLNPIDRALFSPDPKVFVANIDKIIQHGSMPSGPHPAIHMPAWGDTRSLTQQEIANLEAYVMALNGVDRGKLLNPGMRPLPFFIIVLVIFIVAVLILGGMRAKRN
jgi:ubiquinol-cytochrome c reductase cytochrome b subunit